MYTGGVTRTDSGVEGRNEKQLKSNLCTNRSETSNKCINSTNVLQNGTVASENGKLTAYRTKKTSSNLNPVFCASVCSVSSVQHSFPRVHRHASGA